MNERRKFSLKIKIILLFIFTIITLTLFLVLINFFFDWSDYQKKEITINGQKIEVEIVKGFLAQNRGLSRRPALNENKGMLFVFKTPVIRRFWMKEMNFPLDFIWIQGNRIIGFTENVPPEPGRNENDLTIYVSPAPVDKVLEMKNGSVQRLGIKPGNVIIY